jgi:tRNA U34 5-carboxymethylaminomethyl modifying GTPase MnmE/TrmE
VLELQGHGGPVILDLLLKRILTLPGLRIARPGELFSAERAACSELASIRSAMASACARSSLSLRNARGRCA